MNFAQSKTTITKEYEYKNKQSALTAYLLNMVNRQQACKSAPLLSTILQSRHFGSLGVRSHDPSCKKVSVRWKIFFLTL